MIVNNGNKWETLDDDIYTSVNNKQKKVIAVYAGEKIVYPDGFGIYNLNEWTKNGQYSFSDSYSKTNRLNSITINPAGNFWEKIYKLVDVRIGKKVTFSLKFRTNGYNQIPEGNINTGVCMAICRPDANISTYGSPLEYIAIVSRFLKRTYSQDYEKYTLSYNNTQYTKLYLALGFGYVRDGTNADLYFKDISYKLTSI